MEDAAWLKPPRVPLGDPCRGACTAADAFEPGAGELRDFCNSGYARGRCPRFPADGGAPDAFRFSIDRDQGETVSIVFIEETNYTPAAFGRLAYRVATGAFETPPADGNLEAQARMFARSYVARRVQP